MLITLQDVAIILGLRIHGLTITGTCAFDVAELYGELIGVVTPQNLGVVDQPSPTKNLWMSGNPDTTLLCPLYHDP